MAKKKQSNKTKIKAKVTKQKVFHVNDTPVATPSTITLDVEVVVLEIAMSKFKDAHPDKDWESASPELRREFVDIATPIFEKIWKRQ
jgi:hypothetical protein